MIYPVDSAIQHLNNRGLKVFAASEGKLNRVLKETRGAMQDISLHWNQKKCSVVHVKRGAQVLDESGMRMDETTTIMALGEGKTEESWDWLSKGNLKSETESLLIGAQDQALNTNSVRKNIYHQVETDRCGLCGKTVANVTHIVSGCKMPAEKDYKWRYNKVCFHLHWCLSKKYITVSRRRW